MDEQNTGKFNKPGAYIDPQSNEILRVSMPAGADALARLGWEPLSEEDVRKMETKVAASSRTSTESKE